MLVGGYTGGQDFGDDRVGDDRETEIDGAGGGGILQVVDFAQGQYKGVDTVLIIEQDVTRLPALQPAKGQGAAYGKVLACRRR